MSLHRCHRLWPMALLGASSWAHAGKPDPLGASAVVTPAVHESAFQSYRRHTDVTPRDWRTTNDNVGRIGGWRAYAREANAPAVAAPAASPDPHGSHGQPKKGAP